MKEEFVSLPCNSSGADRWSQEGPGTEVPSVLSHHPLGTLPWSARQKLAHNTLLLWVGEKNRTNSRSEYKCGLEVALIVSTPTHWPKLRHVASSAYKEPKKYNFSVGRAKYQR